MQKEDDNDNGKASDGKVYVYKDNEHDIDREWF
jgi:hypothetical protein